MSINYDTLEARLFNGEIATKQEFWQGVGVSNRHHKDSLRANLMPEARALLARLPNADQRANRGPSARLTASDVRTMRRLAAEGESHSSLARRFGVSRVTVIDAVKGRTWQNV